MTSARQISSYLTIGGFKPHTIQRIAGLPAWAHSSPRTTPQTRRYRVVHTVPSIGIVGQTSHAHRQRADLGPFDKPEPDFVANGRPDGYPNPDGDDDNGFGFVEQPDIPQPWNHNDPWVTSTTPDVTIYEGERPELDAEADRILAAGNQQLITKVPGLLEPQPHPTWKLASRVLPSVWHYRPVTYTLGHKPCPRCHGTSNVFAKGRCRYCKGLGGWPITRSRMTPMDIVTGEILYSPPRIEKINPDGSIKLYTPARPKNPFWRTRGPYYGDVRYRRYSASLEKRWAELERLAA